LRESTPDVYNVHIMVATNAIPAATHVAATPATLAPNDPILRMWSQDLSREHGFEPLEVEGTLPTQLTGTLFRNGPGQFGQFGRRYAHPFEADGATTAVRFGGGRASGAARVHASSGLVAERAAGKMLYGLSVPWWRRVRNGLRGRMKNTANTNVVAWQGRLFALMEAGKPTEIDPATLATIGETDLDGAVVSMFSAHPHRVASRKAIYNFGLEYGRVTKLHTYELPDVGPARHLGAVELEGPPMLHDFIATDTHLVFFVSPVRVHIPRMLLQIGTFTDLFRWRPEHGTEVICVPIDDPSSPVRFTVDAFCQWHFTNAFTRNGQIYVDYVRYANFDSFAEIGGLAQSKPASVQALVDGHPHRAVIDLKARTLRSEQTLDRNAEFPTIAGGREGAQHGFSYLVLDELRTIARHDATSGTLAVHTLPDHQRATEAVFVGRPGGTREDDGWLLALCHEVDAAFVAVYDAARVQDGPVARAWLHHHVPITFHGTFVPA
jgi:all-trans-8'-apo-beta-carotenal 15,15'-oxygenase